MYVANQGILLKSKKVDISFTASRGPNGLVAEITIDDEGQLPEFVPEAVTPTLSVVTGSGNEPKADIQPEPQPEPEALEPVKATTSLFN